MKLSSKARLSFLVLIILMGSVIVYATTIGPTGVYDTPWGNFTTGVSTPQLELNGVLRTTWPAGSGGDSQIYEYVITQNAGNVIVYKNDGTNFTESDDIKAFNWVTGNLTTGGSVFIKRPSDGAAYTFTSLPWLIYNDNIKILSDNATITCTNNLASFANDFPAPSWALLHCNASFIEIGGLTFDGNGENENTANPGDVDEKGCLTFMPGSNGLFSAPILAAATQHNLYIHDVLVRHPYQVGIWIGKYNDVTIENVQIKNINSLAGRKGLVLSWVDGGFVDNIEVVMNTDGTFYGSSNCIFYIRMTANGAYQTGVRNVITTNFHLEGSVDSTIELLGGTTASNSNFNNIFANGIIVGRGCYTSINGYNITFSDINMMYSGGSAGIEQGAGGFNAGHNAGGSTAQSVHDITFDNCWVYLINGSLREGFRHVSNGGIIRDITIKNCGVLLPEDYSTSNQSRGVYIDGSSTAAPDHVDRFIIDNFYCNSVGPGVEVDGTDAQSNIWVLNSQFINMGGPNGDFYGVKHDGAGWIYIKDNVFFDELGYMDYGVDITSTADGKFLGNLVNCTTGIRLGGPSGNWTVAWNDFTGSGTAVTDSGADQLVYGDNIAVTGQYATEAAT